MKRHSPQFIDDDFRLRNDSRVPFDWGSLGMQNAAGTEDAMEALRRMSGQPSGEIDHLRMQVEQRARAMQNVQNDAENARRMAALNAYNRALGLRSEHEMAAKVEKQDDGKTFVVDVEASKKAALDLIQQIVTGIPKEMENKAEVRQLKKRVKLLEGQIVRGAAVGQQPEIGTRSIDMDDDE